MTMSIVSYWFDAVREERRCITCASDVSRSQIGMGFSHVSELLLGKTRSMPHSETVRLFRVNAG